MNGNKIEILSPAGSFAALHAALHAGADAVYFGVGNLNMRAGGAVNFTVDDLPEIVRLCHESGAKAYLAVNTIIYNHELDELYTLCDTAKAAGVDACIAGDMAVISYLRQIGMTVHLTVQCNISNIPAVRFYAQFADVMVLARELTLEEIAQISSAIRQEKICGPSGKTVRIEVFAHGALCIALSGRCGMSLCAYNRSANRGVCLQNCRRRYRVTDVETGFELELDHQYVMSPRDLCTVEVLDQILDAGATVLKIEGRGRPADYVSTVTKVYHEAVAAWQNGTFNSELAEDWRKRLETVFNRGFWTGGYYLGMQTGVWSKCGGSQATVQKIYLGKITNFYAKISVAELKIETANSIRPGDKVLVTGHTTGALDVDLKELRLDAGPVPVAAQGDVVAFAVPERVRITDKVYLLKNKENNEENESTAEISGTEAETHICG